MLLPALHRYSLKTITLLRKKTLFHDIYSTKEEEERAAVPFFHMIIWISHSQACAQCAMYMLKKVTFQLKPKNVEFFY